MDDAGAVVISSWEYCFYQTGVDIRNWVLTSWPYKRQWKRETFVHFHHFYLVLPSDSPFFQTGLFLPVPALELDLLVNQSYMTCLLYCHATNSDMYVPHIYMQGSCFLSGIVEIFFFSWTIPTACVIYDSGSGFWEKRPTKKPRHSLKIDAGCELEGQKHLFSPLQHLLHSTTKYFLSFKIWLKPANLKHFILVALLNCSAQQPGHKSSCVSLFWMTSDVSHYRFCEGHFLYLLLPYLLTTQNLPLLPFALFF